MAYIQIKLLGFRFHIYPIMSRAIAASAASLTLGFMISFSTEQRLLRLVIIKIKLITQKTE